MTDEQIKKPLWAIELQARSFCDVYCVCADLGMKHIGGNIDLEDVIAFIRSLAQRAGEDSALLDWAETHPEIAMRNIRSWWAQCGKGSREVSFSFRNVIKSSMESAVTKRKGG